MKNGSYGILIASSPRLHRVKNVDTESTVAAYGVLSCDSLRSCDVLIVLAQRSWCMQCVSTPFAPCFHTHSGTSLTTCRQQRNEKGTSRQKSGKGAIRKRFPLQKPRWEKTKLTIRHLYHDTYRKPNEQLFSQ